MDADYKSLPEPFKKRIDSFRKSDPNFRVESESYEMFTLKEAVKIAEYAKTPAKVLQFRKFKFEKQMKLANISAEHSGNTHGWAIQLAYLLLKDPTKVYKED